MARRDELPEMGLDQFGPRDKLIYPIVEPPVWSPAVVEASLAQEAAEAVYGAAERRWIALEVQAQQAPRRESEASKGVLVDMAARAAQAELEHVGEELTAARVRYSTLLAAEAAQGRIARDRALAEAERCKRTERVSANSSRTRELLKRVGLGG